MSHPLRTPEKPQRNLVRKRKWPRKALVRKWKSSQREKPLKEFVVKVLHYGVVETLEYLGSLTLYIDVGVEKLSLQELDAKWR